MKEKILRNKFLAGLVVGGLICGGLSYIPYYNSTKIITECEIQVRQLLDENENLQAELTDVRQNSDTTIKNLNEQITQYQQSEEQLKYELEHRTRFSASRGNGRVMDVEVTAYTSPAGGVTASGHILSGDISEQVIAVDTDLIPFGSQVQINFDNPQFEHLNGVYTAVDTGGAIRGNIIDLYYGNDDDGAWQFGRQTATIKVL